MNEEQLEAFRRLISDIIDANVQVRDDTDRGLNITITLPSGDNQEVSRSFFLSHIDMMMAYGSRGLDMDRLTQRIRAMAQSVRREMGEHLVQLAEERLRNRRARRHTAEDLRAALPRRAYPPTAEGEDMRWRDQILEQFDQEEEGPLERAFAEQKLRDKEALEEPSIPIIRKTKRQLLNEDPFKCTTTESK